MTQTTTTLTATTINKLERAGFTVDITDEKIHISHMLPDSDEGIITAGDAWMGRTIEDYDRTRWAIVDAIVGDEADTDVSGWLIDGQSGITIDR